MTHMEVKKKTLKAVSEWRPQVAIGEEGKRDINKVMRAGFDSSHVFCIVPEWN